jgi:hypothetical protein
MASQFVIDWKYQASESFGSSYGVSDYRTLFEADCIPSSLGRFFDGLVVIEITIEQREDVGVAREFEHVGGSDREQIVLLDAVDGPL